MTACWALPTAGRGSCPWEGWGQPASRHSLCRRQETSCTEDMLVIQQMGYEKGENATLSLRHCSVVKLLSLQVWRAGDWRGHHGLLNSSLAAKENQRTTEGGGKRCWKQWMLVFITRSKISCMLLEDSQDSSYLLSWELSNWTCFNPKETFVISPKLLNGSSKCTTIEITQKPKVSLMAGFFQKSTFQKQWRVAGVRGGAGPLLQHLRHNSLCRRTQVFPALS